VAPDLESDGPGLDDRRASAFETSFTVSAPALEPTRSC
jgi:hypothetical protein